MKPLGGNVLGVKVGRSDRFMLLLVEVKDSLLGVKSLGVGAFSWTSGGGEGGGLGVAARTVTSDELWPSELRAHSSWTRPKSSSEELFSG